MRHSAILGALVAVGALAPALPGHAATTSPVISGSSASAENSCAWITMVLALSDCTYSNRMVDGFSPALQWIGPTFGGAYYTPGSPEALTTYTPVPGDAKIEPAVTGTLTIDDQGTPSGTDDTIGGTIVIGAASRSIATGAAGRVVETWTSITHTLAPTTVHFATANAGGGFDYIIGDKGDPGRLCASADPTDCFPSENAPGATASTTIWPTPSATALSIERTRNLSNAGVPGPAVAEFQNRGATTTGVLAGYSCITKIGGDCDTSTLVLSDTGGVSGDPREAPGFDNLILLVSTNASGDITEAQAYWTQEYLISLSPPNAQDNSASMGYLSFTGAVPGAKPDSVDTQTETATTIDVLANDAGIADPVTVSISVVPDQGGSAVVNGSPGNQADVDITYTSAPGFSGTETFTYELDDGTLVSSAVVTVTVADTVPAAFTFASQTDVAFSTVVTSAAATITGITTAVPISVAGGEYSVGCTGTFTSTAATITNGQTVCVRHTSAAVASTDTVTTLTIGGVAGTFTSTTAAILPDTNPEQFNFEDATNVAKDTVITSDAVTITGINSPAAIAVSGAAGSEYSIGCNGTFTSTAGTISDGQTVCVRHTSASTAGTAVTTILTVGTAPDAKSDAFSSGTRRSGGGSSSVDGLMLSLLGLVALARRSRRPAR